VEKNASSSGYAVQEGQLYRSCRSGRPFVQVRSVRKASCSGQAWQEGHFLGQAGQEAHLFRSHRSARPVVPIRTVRKESCSGQDGQEGQLFRSGRSERPDVQVRPLWKASHRITAFQTAESRQTYYKN
jgi:hypothetical protein